ncbi:MAG: DUF4365 domain-containing protein [Gemmataceae bacterium]
MTENDQKEHLSRAYVHTVAARAGYSFEIKVTDDDSVDGTIHAKGEVGVGASLKSPRIDVQLKATEVEERLDEATLSFPLPIKNYNELIGEYCAPRLLVVLVLPRDQTTWLEQTEEAMICRRCAYWLSLYNLAPTTNTTTVTVKIPRIQVFTVAELHNLMGRAANREPL